MGINEFAGYFAVGLVALATGWIAGHYGLRPQPFYLSVLFVAAGLLLSALLVRETHHHARHEATLHVTHAEAVVPPQKEILWRTSFADPNLSAISQAGMINNLNDGMACRLFPIVFAAVGINLSQIGWLAAIYPAVWDIGQPFTGRPVLPDRPGGADRPRHGVQAVVAVITTTTAFYLFIIGGALLGLGTAMVYPTLLAAIGDVVNPSWRASMVGGYRLWRNLGYAIGVLLSGIVTDLFGISAAMWLVAVITFASGLIVAVRMQETRHLKSA